MERLLRSKVKECRQQFKEGDIISAKYTDGNYYAAKILQYEGTSVKICYLDDGVIQTVKQHLIKESFTGSMSIRRCVQEKQKIINVSSEVEVNEKPTTTQCKILNVKGKKGKIPSSVSENRRLDQDCEPDHVDDLATYNFSESETEYEPSSESTESDFYSDSDNDTIPQLQKCTKKTEITSNEAQSSNNKTEGIVVCCTTNEKEERNYDKKYFCFFCEHLFSKLPRHLESRHSDEAEVAQIMALKSVKSKEALIRRKNLMTKLRNLGNHKWNCKILKEGKGQLLVTYRPSSGAADPYNYTPCPTCYGYYSKSELWRHNCPLNKNKKKHARLISESRNLLPMPIDVNDDVKSILASMRQDEISRAAKNDFTVCEFIRRMFTVKGGEQNHKKSEIRNNVREISRLLVELRKGKDKSKYTLQDFFEPSLYKEIICGVKKVAGFDENTKEYAAPELARKLGLHIKTCATNALAKAIEENNKYLIERLEQFLKLHRMNYFIDIGAQALRNRVKNQRNKAKLLPLSKDVIKLTNHVTQIMEKSIQTLKSNEGSTELIKSAFVSLQKTSLTQIIVFNRRREGEVSRMVIDDFKNRKKNNEESDLVETLTKTEKALCRLLTRLEIQGKGGRNVPVLLTKTMEEGIELSLKFREVVGVASSNNFLFASCNNSSNLHYRGSDCIRFFANECGATNPKALRSTKLRKQVATLSQVINLKNNELDSLANFLGHDIRIHRQFYRLPDDVMQVAKLSKIFLSLETGNLHQETGKSLDEIQVSVEEYAFEDHTEEEHLEKNMQKTSDEDEGCASSNIASVHMKSNPLRRKWSDEEKAAVDRQLSNHILRGKLPGAAEAKSCINEEPALANRSWRNIKDYCRNKILSNKRN